MVARQMVVRCSKCGKRFIPPVGGTKLATGGALLCRKCAALSKGVKQKKERGISMDTTTIFLTVAGATVCVAILGTIIWRVYGSNGDKSKVLESVFGEPTHTGTFTLSEAMTWVKSHFRTGCQGAIFRADCAALKNYAPDVDFSSGLENYLVMVILDKSGGAMQDSVLVKFEKLDANLEEALGDEGMLVIEN